MASFAIKTPPQHGTWSEFLDVWRAADDIDVFTTGWIFDHFYPLIGDTHGPCLESWVMLSALAQATSRLRIGSMVNGMHYRHPAVTANMAATLDIVSGGRLDLGLGAGWNEEESNAYGIELGNVKDRLDRFEEGVEVIARLLSDEVTTFAGRFFKLTDARCEPKGPQRPHPPIIVGGNGRRRTLRIAAKWAQGWDAGFPADVASWLSLRDTLYEHCGALGRDPSTIRTSMHLAWTTESDSATLAARAHEFVTAGVDQVIFAMRPPYGTAMIEQLARELS